jgi:hypothetical protein
MRLFDLQLKAMNPEGGHGVTSSEPTFNAEVAGLDWSALSMQDRDMLVRYMTLSLADRKTLCDVVAALAVAGSVRARNL